MTPSKWAPVLHASGRWYEAWHVGDPSVVLHDGRFYMAYSATSKPLGKIPGYPAAMVQCIMGAVSQDGIHWTRPQALIANLDGRRWLFLFYATQVGTRKGDGLYHYHYDRIRAMRTEIIVPPHRK